MVKFAVETNLSVENINTDQIRIIGFLFRETKHASVEKERTTLKNIRLLRIVVFTPCLLFGAAAALVCKFQVSGSLSSHLTLFCETNAAAQSTQAQNGGR